MFFQKWFLLKLVFFSFFKRVIICHACISNFVFPFFYLHILLVKGLGQIVSRMDIYTFWLPLCQIVLGTIVSVLPLEHILLLILYQYKFIGWTLLRKVDTYKGLVIEKCCHRSVWCDTLVSYPPGQGLENANASEIPRLSGSAAEPWAG